MAKGYGVAGAYAGADTAPFTGKGEVFHNTGGFIWLHGCMGASPEAGVTENALFPVDNGGGAACVGRVI